MSKTRLIVALAVAACTLGAQNMMDQPGVTVDTGGAVLHRTAVPYPDAARTKNIQGVVVVEAAIDNSGNVTDTRVLSGPSELRRAAQQSVLQWHFAMDSSSLTRQVKITFQIPEGKNAPMQAMIAPLPAGETDPAKIAAAQDKIKVLRAQITDQIAQLQATQDPAARQQGTARLNEMQGNVSTLQRTLGPASLAGKKLARLNVIGVPDKVRDDLMARIPVRTGDTLSSDTFARISAIVHDFDEHMAVSQGIAPNDDVSITIFAGSGTVSTGGVAGGLVSSGPAGPGAPKRITIGGYVQQAKLISQTAPQYPPQAKAARISGVVKFQVVIAKDGTILDIKVISGHPLLVPAALDAVKTWVYQPTLLNGEPVEVSSQIDVNFTLSDQPPAPGGGQ